MPSSFKNLIVNDTGFLEFPRGTEAQRPTATQTVQSFTTVGTTSWTCPAGVTSVEVLVVAGGGGGGSGLGAGGGAGGLIYDSNYPVIPGTSYSITVGSGGNGGAAGAANNGANGNNSSFGTLIAIGGGGGAGVGSRSNGGNGGSGGGGGWYTTTEGGGNGGSGTPGQGQRGGNVLSGSNFVQNSYSNPHSGGGGGAGGAGGDGVEAITGKNTEPSGFGGAGLNFSITGTPTWYAGGGGAGRFSTQNNAGQGAPGGIGGGGSGGSNGQSGNNAVANTGGGGGGGDYSPTRYAGGNGAQGIVVLRYLTDSDLDNPVGKVRYNTNVNTIESFSKNNWNIGTSGIRTQGLALYLDAINYDNSTIWRDISGRNNHFTLVNNPAYTSNASSKYSYFSFNGSTQYAYRTGAINDDFYFADKDYTVEAWVYANGSGSTTQVVLNRSDGGAASNSAFYFGFATDGVSNYVSDGTSWDYWAQNDGKTYSGRWHYVVWQRKGNSLVNYVDGGVAGKTLLPTTGFTLGNSSRDIQLFTQNLQQYSNSSISILRVYTGVALTPDEIKNHYNIEYPRFALTQLVTQGPTVSIPTEGLVLHLDAGNPASYPGYGNLWSDLTGIADCTLVGYPTFSNDGGGSIVFDSSNSQKGTFPSVTLPTRHSASATMWFKTTSTSAYQNMFDMADSDGLRFWINAGQLGAAWDTGSIGYQTSNFSANTWYNITITGDGSFTYVYLNGVLIGRSSGTGPKVYTGLNMTGARIAQVDGDRATEYFYGNISIFAIYKKVLSHQEVRQFFEATRYRHGV